ncbi:MAG: fused MFS/spermidine synthase [Betaproteobacteria bacterium]|nr:fused MFS/spermidine synthase [Betaproteobacteria bacterium]MDH3436137.1 fused MFS/spermidine synthase [Betaproteobacteria bacterium]
MLLYAIIFLSGGAVLALELLASRIMTPYFGVSLYIWTGILSITLVALAFGYRLGGKLARGRGNAIAGAARLAQLYMVLPAVAAFGIVLACLVYPYLFPVLARADLVLGSFAACLLLLFVPLVAASAMNPLLVALLLARGGGPTGDAGAGTVFFVSTVGSVAGVFVTAFGLIPTVSNFSATLAVALVLALVSLAAAARPPAPLLARRKLGIAAACATLCAALLLWQADAYIGRMWPASYAGQLWRIEARFSSLFGTVKILRNETDPETGRFARMYFQDGLIQNTVRSDGRSLSFYTYALEALAYAHRPRIGSALVLGLGAGVVPRRLAAQGVSVEVVEIDPASLAAAQQFFDFDARRVRVHLEDARTYLRRCSQRYDVVVVDLFYGDGTPEYLVTRDFFSDLRRCLAADGVALFNTFADLDLPNAYAHLLITLRSELPYVRLYRPDWPGAAHVNSFVVAGLRPLPDPRPVTLDYVPPRHSAALTAMLARPQALHHDLLDEGEIVTDANNHGVHDMAESQLVYRQGVVRALPAAFLVN